MRCPYCGRRLHQPHGQCDEHGLQSTTEPLPVDDERRPTVEGYELQRVLGRGGFATVYLALRLPQREPVAIKVAARNGFAEASLASEVRLMRHAGESTAPRVYASGVTTDGRPYLSLEFIDDPTLASQLAKPFPLANFILAALKVATAVRAIHAQGMVHADLKPENVFLGRHARLIDFGLAQQVDSPESAEATELATLPGTPEYLAPDTRLSFASDVYALGVMLYEMLTGRVPFFGTSAEVRQAHLNRRPLRPSTWVDVPPRLESLILRCLAKDVAMRPNSAEVVDELRAAANDALLEQPTERPTLNSPKVLKGKERTKRAVGVVFFNSAESAARLKAVLSELGGQLTAHQGQRIAAVFDIESGENLAQRALEAAERLVARGVTSQVRVDLVPVMVRTRPDGTRGYMTSVFERAESYPLPGDGVSVTVTSRAAQSLPTTERLVLWSDELLALRPDTEIAEQVTKFSRKWSPSIGREALVEQLRADARTALTAKIPTLLTVVGDAGTGKSHLALELSHHLEAELAGLDLVSLHVSEPAGYQRDQALRELLRLALRLPAKRPSDGGRAAVVAAVGEEAAKDVWAAVALMMGWVSHDLPEVKAMTAAPGALRRAASRAVVEALRQRAAEAPLALLIDGLQFADDAFLDAVEQLTQSEVAAGIWVCALARPTFELARSHWGAQTPARRSHRLEALDTEGARRLFQQLLLPAEDIPLAAIDKLVERTRGIPLLMVELVRALRTQGLIRRQGRAQGWYLATDEVEHDANVPLVDWLAVRELATLPPDVAAHAQLLSLLGADFTVTDIAGVLDMLDRDGHAAAFPLEAAAGARQLVSLGILVAHRQGRLTFRHGLVQEAIARGVSDELRQVVHSAALRFYLQATAPSTEARAGRIALHALAAGNRAEAIKAYDTLAGLARDSHAYFDAEAMYSHVLDLLPAESVGDCMTALQGRGLMRYRLSRYEDAMRDFEAAKALAQTLNDSAAVIDILLDEATALDWMEEYQRSSDVVDEAAHVSSGQASPLVEARLCLGIGRAHVRFSREADAAEWLSRAADLAQPLGDAGYETWVIALLLNGYVLTTLGRLAEAQAAFEQVIPACVARGDKLHLGAAVGNRFMLWSTLNNRERLFEDLERLLAIARELGNARMQKTAHFYLGLYLHWVGSPAAAEEHARKVVALDQRTLGQGARPESMVLLARTLAAAGNIDGARKLLEEIKTHLAQGQARHDVEVTLVPAEEVLFSMVQLYVSDAPEREWNGLRGRADTYLTGQDVIEFYEFEGRAALRRGAMAQAERAFGHAYTLAQRIPNVMAERIKTQWEQAQLELAA